MPAYHVAIPPSVAGRIRHLSPDLKRAVRETIRAIADDPGRGEPLKRELSACLKYRVRRFRIVYRVDRDAKSVAILAVGHRRTIYEEFAAAVNPRSTDRRGD